jgi:hypothetical protein
MDEIVMINNHPMLENANPRLCVCAFSFHHQATPLAEARRRSSTLFSSPLSYNPELASTTYS